MLYVHYPLRPLTMRFGHLLNDEAQDVSGLIEEPCFDNVVSQDMRRHPPLLSMFDMCIYAPFVDDIAPPSLVYHGCLSQLGSRFIRVFDRIPRDVSIGSVRSIDRRWFCSRCTGIVWVFQSSCALWDLRCGGTNLWLFCVGEARERSRIWIEDVEAADQSEEEDQGSYW